MELHFGQRIVYQTDSRGFYTGQTAADPDPLTPGRWLVPAGAVEVAPPLITGMKVPQWVGYKWKMVDPE